MDAEQRSLLPESAALLTRIANSFGADLVHSNQLCYGDLGCGLPVLVTVHSDVRSWSLACRGALPDSSPWMERYDRLVEQGLRAARAIVAPTVWMLAQILRHYGPLNRTAVIPNGRSLADPAEPSTRLLQAATVGRLWDEAKDLRLLGSVMSPMPFAGSRRNAWAGDRGLAPVPGVRMLGSLSETRVLDLFRRSAVYIVPSTFEPFGLAPLEAALCGCAIVARDIASLHEVWGDAAVYFRDAGELSALLTVLHADAPGLRNLQARARTRAIERYGRDRMTQLYLVQYRAAIAASRADRIGKLDVA